MVAVSLEGLGDGFGRTGDNRATLAARLDEGGGLTLENIEVVFATKVEIAAHLHLAYLALGHIDHGGGDGTDQVEVAVLGEKAHGAGEQHVAGKDARGVAHFGSGGGFAPAHGGVVDHVVVDEGRHVDHLQPAPSLRAREGS